MRLIKVFIYFCSKHFYFNKFDLNLILIIYLEIYCLSILPKEKLKNKNCYKYFSKIQYSKYFQLRFKIILNTSYVYIYI